MGHTAYRLDEGRWLYDKSIASAVAGTSAFDSSFVVPAGRLWAVIFASVNVDMAETRDFTLCVYNALRGSLTHGIAMRAAALAGGAPIPLLTEGSELLMWPGDRPSVIRSAATAGSTMTLYLRIIETDLPPLTYIDPQKLIAQNRRRGKFSTALSLARGEAPAPDGPGTGGPGAVTLPAPPSVPERY